MGGPSEHGPPEGEIDHRELRKLCSDPIERNRPEFCWFIKRRTFEEELQEARGNGTWVGEMFILALTRVFDRSAVVFQDGGRPTLDYPGGTSSDNDVSVFLYYADQNRYESLRRT